MYKRNDEEFLDAVSLFFVRPISNPKPYQWRRRWFDSNHIFSENVLKEIEKLEVPIVKNLLNDKMLALTDENSPRRPCQRHRERQVTEKQLRPYCLETC